MGECFFPRSETDLQFRVDEAAGPAVVLPARARLTSQDEARGGSIGQTLEGSFSAVSKPTFASKYAFETGTLTLSENGLREEKNNNYFNGVFKK